jgi:hypothetical protein
MDSILTWKLSGDVETLVKTIVSCRQELTTMCFSKYGRAHLEECNVYASAKVIELLQLSSSWTDALPTVQIIEVADSLRRHVYSPKTASEHVADFEQFKLHKDFILGDDTIRVLCLYDVAQGNTKLWFGNVMIESI